MENKSASQHPIYSHYRRVTERLLKNVLSMNAVELIDDSIRANKSTERMFCSLLNYLEEIEDYERCIELQRIFEAFKQILNDGK
jgi:hypothetical protein